MPDKISKKRDRSDVGGLKTQKIPKNKKAKTVAEPGVVTKSMKFLKDDDADDVIQQLGNDNLNDLYTLIYDRRTRELNELVSQMAFDDEERKWYATWYKDIYIPNQNELLHLWFGQVSIFLR